MVMARSGCLRRLGHVLHFKCNWIPVQQVTPQTPSLDPRPRPLTREKGSEQFLGLSSELWEANQNWSMHVTLRISMIKNGCDFCCIAFPETLGQTQKTGSRAIVGSTYIVGG